LSRFAVVTVLLALTVTGCGPKKSIAPTGILEADKFLFDRGQELLAKRKWLQAREHFQQVVENYPQSTYRPEAKLALGDTYIGEGSTESLILAQNEFREFLTFYPTHGRADYAQYRLGYTHYKQMLAPDRDQTATREAVAEWQLFMERYPNSAIRSEVDAKLREARDRLSASEYRVGLFYFRVKWYPGAIDRFKSVLTQDPGFTGRDAVYFYLAESLVVVNRPAEALPYFDRLTKEFIQSEYLAQAEKRIAALKTATAVPK
jgi:outer membrane protein assembly factor BamD